MGIEKARWRQRPDGVVEKRCPGPLCLGAWKTHLDSFYKNDPYCKKCRNAITTKWRQDNGWRPPKAKVAA